MDEDIVIKCKNCGREAKITLEEAEQLIDKAPIPNMMSMTIYTYLSKIKSQLKCSKCGKKSAQILPSSYEYNKAQYKRMKELYRRWSMSDIFGDE